jgi:hypothetical protein
MPHDEVDAIVTFYESWRQDGVGEDGLPLYEQVVMCRKAKPPLLMVEDAATEEDQDYFADAWKLFQKGRKVRDISVKGYPLALWPVIGPTDLQTLVVRDIVTVEQLAELADSKTNKLPAHLVELASRAKKLLTMQGKVGKFEAIIHELTAQRDALQTELKEANNTISAQNAMISQMRMMPQQAA